MKHINRLAADQKLTTDENNNESDSTDRKRHPFGHRSLGYHFRSNSVDLACDCVSEPDLTNLADVGALSKSVQTLSLTGRERSSSVADLTIELGDFSSFETSSIVNKSDSSDAIESDDKIDGSDLDRLPVFAQGPLDRCSCIICLDERTLHRRLCCDFAACDSCLAAYYEHKLQLGQFSMECINSACRTPAGRDEIRALLCPKSRDIYRSLLLANNDLGKLTRTCPQCNHLMRLRDSAQLKLMRSQRKKDQTASR